MYSRFKLARKYLRYYLFSSNGKGHGIHSPFVFDFIKNVLNEKKAYSIFLIIEKLRQELLKNENTIDVVDFGAGSVMLAYNKRKIKDIARSSLKPRKFSQLLFRIAQNYNPQTIVELGTSLGVTTAYLANANKNNEVFTFEGSKNIAEVAQSNFHKLELQNIELIRGNFDDTLQKKLSLIPSIDLAFIDGNHRKEPTLKYFRQLLKRASEQSIFIFDDIHWSVEMEAAWKEIQQHNAVTLTIDLFFIGIVFFRKDFKTKQHFVIRF